MPLSKHKYLAIVLVSLASACVSAQDFFDLRKEILTGRVPYPSSVTSERLLQGSDLRMKAVSSCQSSFCFSTNAAVVDWPLSADADVLAAVQLHAGSKPTVLNAPENYIVIVDVDTAEPSEYRQKLMGLALNSLAKSIGSNATVTLYSTRVGAAPILAESTYNRTVRRSITQAADNITADSRATVGDALPAIARDLSTRLEDDSQHHRVVFLTNRSAQDFSSVSSPFIDGVKKLQTKGVSVIAVAVGVHLNESVRQALHEMSYTRDLYVRDEVAAKKAFSSKQQSSLNIVTGPTEIQIKAQSGYTIKDVLGIPKSWVKQQSKQVITIRVPSIFADLLGNGLFVAIKSPDKADAESVNKTILNVEARIENNAGVEEYISSELLSVAAELSKALKTAALIISQHVYLSNALRIFYSEEDNRLATRVSRELVIYNRPQLKNKWPEKYEEVLRAVYILDLRLAWLSRSMETSSLEKMKEIQGTWVVQLVKNRYLTKMFGRDEFLHISPDGRLAVSTSADPSDTGSFAVLRDFHIDGTKLISLGYYRQDFRMQREGDVLRLQDSRICSTQDGRCDAVFRFHQPLSDDFFLAGYGSL